MGRFDARRRGAVLRAVELEPVEDDGRAAAVLRVDALRVAGLRGAALRVVDLAVLLAVAGFARRFVVAPRDDAPRATCCTCLLRLSRRFKTLSTSACFARLRTCACSWSIAEASVF